jgi:ketosteroid isomerase-like protein
MKPKPAPSSSPGSADRAVSEGNVDLICRAVEAINARQVPNVTDDVRIETPATAVTGGTLVGEQGWREWMSEFFDAFGDDARMQVDEILAEGEDYVAALVSLVGPGATSEIPLTLRWANVWWLREGQIVRAAGFLHTREALRAVGLEE